MNFLLDSPSLILRENQHLIFFFFFLREKFHHFFSYKRNSPVSLLYYSCRSIKVLSSATLLNVWSYLLRRSQNSATHAITSTPECNKLTETASSTIFVMVFAGTLYARVRNDLLPSSMLTFGDEFSVGFPFTRLSENQHLIFFEIA